MALKEAIRRSLHDLRMKEEDTAGHTTPVSMAPSAPAEAPATNKEGVKQDAPEADDQKAVPMEVDAVESPITKKEPTGTKVVVETVEPMTSPPLLIESWAFAPAELAAKKAHSPAKMSDTSFEDEAEGNGDIAKLVGSTLDKFAAAIDDFNHEFDRKLQGEEDEIVVTPSGTDDKGTKIVEGEDVADEDDDAISQGSWDVVADEQQFASDEALARAAHVIGSALFQSDMVQSVQSTGNISTLSQSTDGASSDGPSVTPSSMSVPTNPGSVAHCQLDRWAVQLSELHGMGLDDDVKLVEILEKLSAANLGCDCDDEIETERVVDEYYK
jgi:hypothetical protein